MPLAELEKTVIEQEATKGLNLLVRLARLEDSEAITATYERVFGKGGIKAPGHEAYPAPEVFSTEGVRGVITDSSRRFIVAEVDGAIAGGMIINLLSPYNCEFCCVSVDPAYRNLGISPRLLSFARKLADQSILTINSTEIVTHSVHSQTAHNGVGYGKVTGFGFCQYPRVFFARHPESVLWVTAIQGLVAERLRAARTGVDSPAGFAHELSEESLLFNGLYRTRQVFVPESYKNLVSEILAQFVDTIDYQVSGPVSGSQTSVGNGGTNTIKTDLCSNEPYGYIKLPSELLPSWPSALDSSIDSLKAHGKRFIQAKIPANAPSAPAYAQHLQKKGFVFLGLLPLWSLQTNDDGQPLFDDLLVMQWLDADTVANNPLPGETDSVVKLYGYPANLSGTLLKVIRKELYALTDSDESRQYSQLR